MSLELSIREICGGLRSERVTERKKNAEALRTYLNNEAAPTLLSENTIKKNGYGWNNMFDDVNEFILKECEKYETSRSFENIKPIASNLLQIIVASSNKDKAYIKCEKITDACLFILNTVRLRKAFGDAYLNMLYKHVLQQEYYMGSITSNTWRDLLDICIAVYCSGHSIIDGYTNFRLIMLIIHNAVNYCQFINYLAELLPKLKRCFILTISDKKMQEVMIETAVLLTEQLAPECRLTMCEFTENTVSLLIRCYETNLDFKRKDQLFKFLHLAVKLHHPQGKLQCENGSFAMDWTTWKTKLNSILEVINSEINSLQKALEYKFKYQNENPRQKLSNSFLELAASVYYLVFNEPQEANDNPEGSSSKRQCVRRNKYLSFNDLIDALRQNVIPWLRILYTYITNYSHSLCKQNYFKLLVTLEIYISNNDVHFAWEYFEKVVIVTLDKLKQEPDGNTELIMNLWKTCVRHSTSSNQSHGPVHSILQSILDFEFLYNDDVKPLMKLYQEKVMPVTDSSLSTLNKVLSKYFNTYCSSNGSDLYIKFLLNGEYLMVNDHLIKELLMRVMSIEKNNIPDNNIVEHKCDPLYDMLFTDLEKSILFSAFELDIQLLQDKIIDKKDCLQKVKSNEYFTVYLQTTLKEFRDGGKKLIDVVKLLQITLQYCDILLKCKFVTSDDIKELNLHEELNNTLRNMFKEVEKYLKTNDSVNLKVTLLNRIQDIFHHEYDMYLCELVRTCIDESFFYALNTTIHSKSEEEMEVDDDNRQAEEVRYSLRHSCICLLAAYCRKSVLYQKDVLELIMSSDTYNFRNHCDINTAFRCIELLTDRVDTPPTEAIFCLLRVMCKELFRNPAATLRILEILHKLINFIFTNPSKVMKDNCIIMIKSYLSRCEKLFYPPSVVALLYKCIEKIISVNDGIDGLFFRESLLHSLNSNSHTLRLYCAYLLVKNEKINIFMEKNMNFLCNIFAIDISERSESLKDELPNRTAIVLHCFHALSLNKENIVLDVIKYVLEMQKVKKLNNNVVKKVLNKMVKFVTSKSSEEYLNKNLLSVLRFWLQRNHAIQELPVVFFGFINFERFVEKHMCIVLPAELIWSKEGVLNNSELIPLLNKKNKSNEAILENCFPYIIAFCIPYIACDKLNIKSSRMDDKFLKITQSATNLYQSCIQTLGSKKWTKLFVEKMATFFLFIVIQLHDTAGIKENYGITISQLSTFDCSMEVFDAFLRYIGVVIDLNAMQYLTKNQTLSVCKIIIKLWTQVLEENVYELKVLALHRFITVFDKIPQNNSCYKFISNFACNNLMYAIKQSNDKKETLVFAKALRLVLGRLLPSNLDVIEKVMPQIMSTLIIKKEEGYGEDCELLLNYLLVDMKGYLKDSIDLVDGSQNMIENSFLSTRSSVGNSLKQFVSKLMHYSFETICNLKEYLKSNRDDISDLYKNLKTINGFSEECNDSLIHQLMNALIKIVKTSADSATIIEACNCLAELGVCDMKTLVMVAPADTKKVLELKPTQLFALITLKHLSEVTFDQCPTIVNHAVNALTSLLKYREGVAAMEYGQVDKAILQPFTSTRVSSSYANFSIDSNSFSVWNNPSVWIPNEDTDYLEWLRKLTLLLLNSITCEGNYISTLIVICNAKPILCEKILPPLLGLLFSYTTGEQVAAISSMINKFFHHFLEKFSNGYSEDSNEIIKYDNKPLLTHKYKMIVKCMLEVVDFIRLQRSHYNKWSTELLETYNYLGLDYKAVAWAANLADKNITAIYYGELWCIAQNNGVPPVSPEDTSKLDGGETVQKVFYKAFLAIGDTAALDGCGTGHLKDESERRKHLVRSGRAVDSLLMHDIALTCENTLGNDPSDLHYGVVKSLHNTGMYHIALQYIKSLPDNSDLDDMKYECCSQLGDWSIFVDTADLEVKAKTTNVNLESIIKAFRYACLKDCLTVDRDQEQDKLHTPLQKAKSVISLLCQKLNMDNCQHVYNVISKLQMFRDIEDYYSVRCDKLALADLLHYWRVANLPPYHDLKYLENLLSQRCLILEHAAKSNGDLFNDIISLHLNYAELLLDNDRSHISQRYIAVAKKLQDSGEVSMVEGQVSWALGHKDIALSLIRKLTLTISDNNTLMATALRQYGNWMVESKYESGKEIIDKYLKRSLEVLGPNGRGGTRLKVYYDIAKFADTEYKQVVSYMKSKTFLDKIKCMKNMKGSATSFRNSQLNISKDEKKAMITNEKLSKLDEEEIASTHAEKTRFLHLAMKYYLLSLIQGEDNNLSVFRVISLWLENSTLEFEDKQDGSFKQLLCGVPSRKYLPVLPQLAPRLTADKKQFGPNLITILSKCASDHPHHTLPILFGLKNSHKDLVIMNASATSSNSMPPRANEEQRVTVANKLVKKLAEYDEQLATIIQQMDTMCDAIISFANYKTTSKSEKQTVPRSEQLTRLRNLDSIPIPTVTLPIRNDCIYSDVPSITSFGETFNLVGGINCPKKMSCRGSDGKDRTILIKGEDDLRQDAVMQQVFTIVNTLLETNCVTSKYRLLIRTYKVVPLSRRSGVLEWCEGTVPLGHYLVGDNAKLEGAHKRYRPMDISCHAARTKLNECTGKSNTDKLLVFLNILKNFKPVFHYFFTEHYSDPITWYERRQAYVKSVAASSMVGYTLGLGDRHVQNILIDKRTSEFIHIDFGIAFEQGKALPSPETVPFRLTQDIVSGFGPSGVEGNFRRYCEMTMQLLRDNQDTLLTTLEVLLCDPLYSWTVTPAQAKRKQNMNTTPAPRESTAEGNPDDTPSGEGGPAERALLVVRSKLSGTEGGVARGVRVPGQIARLLRHATDPANLCRLFHGWQPYL